MFTVYLDESYGEEDAYSVGGYVATNEQWEKFNREWKEFLMEFEIPELHKKDFEHLWGHYKKWRILTKREQDEIKKRINQRACGIILRRVNAGFGSSVKKSDWLAVDKGRWSRALGESFYAAGVKSCMNSVAVWAQDFKQDGPIDYKFECGAEGAAEVKRMLQSIEADENRRRFYRLGKWEFIRKKSKDGKPDKAVPLQAADFLAYETYRHMGNRVVSGVRQHNGVEIPMRGALKCLFQHYSIEYDGVPINKRPTPHYMIYFDKHMISRFLESMGDRDESEVP